MTLGQVGALVTGVIGLVAVILLAVLYLRS
jgi:hypothetical protein